MKKAIILFFAFINIANAFSQNLNGEYYGWLIVGNNSNPLTFIFTNNNYEINIDFYEGVPAEFKNFPMGMNHGTANYKEKGTYKITEENNIPFIEWNNSKILNRNGILYSEKILMLYDKKNNCIFHSKYDGKASESFPYIIDTKASSELIENKTSYSGNNVIWYPNSLRESLPWVEATDGYGIGESIIVEIRRYMDITGFIISNGFVNFERTDLYKKNSRIRVVEVIKGSGSGSGKQYILDDTANFQYLALPENLITRYVSDATIPPLTYYTFIIRDVYQGDTWDDTCLNMIIPTTQMNYR
jgi:hypothetical protein